MSSNSNYQEKKLYWYDRIPSSWFRTKNKYIFSNNKEIVGDNWKKFTLLTMGKSGVRSRDMNAGGKFPENFENYQIVNPNQIIFCLFDIDETPRTVGLSKEHGMITSAYDVLSTNKNHDPRFWTYFYQMIDDHKGLRPYYSGLRKVVRNDKFMSIDVYSPPLSEQNLISEYLDKKTDQVDRLIEKLNKKTKLLEEQKKSFLNYFITKGLKTKIRMKESGIKWIGKIPNHWKISKLKFVSKVKNGSTPKSNIDDFWDGSIRWFTPTDFKNKDKYGYLNSSLRNITQNGLDNSGCSLIENTSILITTRAPVGNLSIINGPFTFNQGCKSVTPDNIELNYLYFYLLLIEEPLNILSNGTTFKELSTDNLLNFQIPLPPLSEQKEISLHLKNILNKSQNALFLLMKKISTLIEYRKSIIYSTVTGRTKISKDMI